MRPQFVNVQSASGSTQNYNVIMVDEGMTGVVSITEFISQLGDVNGDYEINVEDIIVLLNLIFDIFEDGDIPDEIDLQTGDIYPDGQINIVDIVGLINIILDQ